MMYNESPIIHDDIYVSSFQTIQNDQLPTDLADIDISNDFDLLNSILPSQQDNDILEALLINEFLSTNHFDPLSDLAIPSKSYECITPSQSPSLDEKHIPDMFLSFINPPEPYYHVRYLSEITNMPVKNNVVNVKNKSKRNTSGRYLKGIRSRYITISLPSNLTDLSNLFIRVTRLTVPFEGIHFIHPYPLLYSEKKPRNVIIDHKSVYYKLSKDDLHNCTKQFPNMILTRQKQGELNGMPHLYPFDNDYIAYQFEGANAKQKILNYQLKKSILDFRLVIRDEENNTFINTNVFCRSEELVEAEGIEWKNLRKKNFF